MKASDKATLFILTASLAVLPWYVVGPWMFLVYYLPKAPGFRAPVTVAAMHLLYLLPLAAFRCFGLFYPLKEGVSYLDGEDFSPWWAGHQIQSVFIGIPQLEVALKLVPGLFSLWLRAWGSKVGSSVYWTPRVEIVDRSLMDIGDRVIFGHKIECFAHTIKPKNGQLILYVRRIAIGSDVFLGAGTRIGPGVRIEAGVNVPILTDLFMNKKVSA